MHTPGVAIPPLVTPASRIIIRVSGVRIPPPLFWFSASSGSQRVRTSNLRCRRRQAGFCSGFTGLVATEIRNDRGAREFAT
jgi:hypothetical protein